MAGRPRKVTASHPVHLLLPEETVAGLDEWVAEVRLEVPGGSGITRADLVRDVLQKAINERRKARKGTKR